jgi:hypothetical protein
VLSVLVEGGVMNVGIRSAPHEGKCAFFFFVKEKRNEEAQQFLEFILGS